MQLHEEDIAIEIAKTLFSSDQRTLIRAAENRKMTTVAAISQVSFDFADAFMAEYNKRYE